MPYDAPPFRRDDRPNGFLSGQANDITLYGTMQDFKTQYVVLVAKNQDEIVKKIRRALQNRERSVAIT